MSFSMYIIKPEGMKYRAQIRDVLQRSGLKIIDSTEILLTNGILDGLYDNVNKEVRRELHRFLEDQFVEIGIVRGHNALSRLVEVTGKNTNPALCEEGTIRRLFGWSEPLLLHGRYYYFGNVIHRPKNMKELRHDLVIAKEYLITH